MLISNRPAVAALPVARFTAAPESTERVATERPASKASSAFTNGNNSTARFRLKQQQQRDAAIRQQLLDTGLPPSPAPTATTPPGALQQLATRLDNAALASQLTGLQALLNQRGTPQSAQQAGVLHQVALHLPLLHDADAARTIHYLLQSTALLEAADRSAMLAVLIGRIQVLQPQQQAAHYQQVLRQLGPHDGQLMQRLATQLGNVPALDRSSLFVAVTSRTTALPPEQQARALQVVSQQLRQLDQADRSHAMRLILALANDLPPPEHGVALEKLASQLRHLPADARRDGFDALMAGMAGLLPSLRARLLPALAKALGAAGKDTDRFHAVQTLSKTVHPDAQDRILPGLIRHLGRMPLAQRPHAFAVLADQVAGLPESGRRNGLHGLRGKLHKLPPDRTAAGMSHLQRIGNTLTAASTPTLSASA